jgi:hypothetical protein
VQGGGLLVQLFCTNGNCILVAPVVELIMKPFSWPDEMLGKFAFADPAMPG